MRNGVVGFVNVLKMVVVGFGNVLKMVVIGFGNVFKIVVVGLKFKIIEFKNLVVFVLMLILNVVIEESKE